MTIMKNFNSLCDNEQLGACKRKQFKLIQQYQNLEIVKMKSEEVKIVDVQNNVLFIFICSIYIYTSFMMSTNIHLFHVYFIYHGTTHYARLIHTQ